MHSATNGSIPAAQRSVRNRPASWGVQQQGRSDLRRVVPRSRLFARGKGGGDDDGGGGSGGRGGGGGDASSGGPGWRGPLLWAAAWAAAAELYSELQYRGMAARDARRRAELFPSSSPPPPPPLGPQQAAAGAAPTPSEPPLPPNPSVSIIIPALNEEAGLQATLQYLQQELRPPAAEIIVVDGGSADRTAQVARRCGVRVLAAGRGRARQMNAGAAAARGGALGGWEQGRWR